MFRYGLKSAHADGLVTDGANGLVVPAGDVDGLRKAIERICRDSTLRARLSAAAFESVAAYSISSVVSQIEEQYYEMLAERPRW
jgi:glycosyltransferase involved in cell wall biosynthesis